MGHKMDMLNHHRKIVGQYGSMMDDFGRAYNDMQLRWLEAEAFEEMKQEVVQSLRAEMAKANSDNAKKFAGEVDKAFKSLGFK